MNALRSFAKIEDGATVIEYAFILSLLAMSLVVLFGSLGNNILAIFDYINTSLPIE